MAEGTARRGPGSVKAGVDTDTVRQQDRTRHRPGTSAQPLVQQVHRRDCARQLALRQRPTTALTHGEGGSAPCHPQMRLLSVPGSQGCSACCA